MAPPVQRDDWLIDGNDNIALAIRHTGTCLFRKQSPYQLVEVFETSEYGKTLMVDGLVMCTETDEPAYHEMIVHVPMFASGQVQDVLVIGGGDGGTIREVLRHPQVKSVVLAEIDEVVIQAAKECLPSLSRAFGHPKLTIQIGDGIEYMRQAPDESFDLIIVDSSDPVGPAEGLFNIAFYQDLHRCLRPDGVMTAQSESPWFHRPAFVELNRCLQQVFATESTHPYLIFIPSYPSGMWSFVYAAKGNTHPWQNCDRTTIQQFTQQENLQYYNADIHQAAFQLPTFAKNLVQGS
jgi:spermidine synthase